MTQPTTEFQFIAVRSAAHIACVARLAREIWTDYYLPIIGSAQVEYMLTNLQSELAIARQLAEGYEYFLFEPSSDSNGMQTTMSNWLGYCAAQPQLATRRLFIGKLYLKAALRGQGLGRVMLDYLVQLARLRGLSTLWLTVNKHNPALRQYLRWGFVNVAAITIDIGGGYVMDDFQLEKQVL